MASATCLSAFSVHAPMKETGDYIALSGTVFSAPLLLCTPWACARSTVHRVRGLTFQFSRQVSFSIILVLLCNPSFFSPNNI